jgi:protein-S-isoprenylcysteine O-methyltransferase Ste14
MIASPAPLIVIISAIAVLAATGNLFAASAPAIAFQVIAVALSIWSRRSFPNGTFRVGAAPGGASIIRRGPYRVIRHPMYAAVLLFIWAAALSHPSLLPVAVATVVTLTVAIRVVTEERLLRARYPDYVDYARSTKAIVPFIL